MNLRYKEKETSGFSLVEMSIVIIVIGLILAAVMKGRVVIDIARTRALISEINNYKAAVGSFYAKYKALPGDFSEASVYWTGENTVSGNGDGKISFQSDAGIYEGYQAWQHLSNESMVNLLLTGTQTTGLALLDVDVPRAKVGGGYFFDYGSIGTLTQNNLLILGVPLVPAGGNYPARLTLDGGLTPKQAYDLDVKIDDGLPSGGAVQSANGTNAEAGSCVVTSDSSYNISLDEKKCITALKLNN